MNNGVIPINNIVDKFSYITLLTNIPMAIYDADKVDNNFSINLDSNNHRVLCFDNIERTTNSKDIVVLNKNEAISIAGCIGSKNFGIDNNTKSIYIEIANFNYLYIKDTSRRLNIATDASKRFSKPMSDYLFLLTLHFITQNFNTIECLKIHTTDVKQISFEIDWTYISSLLGMELKHDVVAKYLNYFGINITNNTCVVPKYRLDIKTNQDLVEEIIKIFDINEIPASPIYESTKEQETNLTHELIVKLKQMLLTNHISEVKTYNLTNKNNLNKFNVFNYTKFVDIKNVNNLDRAFLRSNLIERMLKIYQLNNSYKTELQPIFEVQKIYSDKTYNNLTILLPQTIYIDRLSNSKIEINLN
jgi:phenylalanyl-tRNA synthetase beta chain